MNRIKMGYVKSYKELSIWQKSMDLVIGIYSILNKFPAEENFALSSQMRRSVVSIPSNIAEGFGRHSDGDFIRFLQISKGSLCELQTQVEIAQRLNYIGDEYESIEKQCDELSKMLSSFIVSIRERNKSKNAQNNHSH